MGPNPAQYPQMVADIPQEDIPPLAEEDDIQEEEEPEGDKDSKDKGERCEE